jgi:hypothetical protein
MIELRRKVMASLACDQQRITIKQFKGLQGVFKQGAATHMDHRFGCPDALIAKSPSSSSGCNQER